MRAITGAVHKVLVSPKLAEIATMLSLSDKTVSTYRTRVLENLSLKTNAELVRDALEHSLIE